MLTTSYPLEPDGFEGFFVQELAEHLARLCPVTVLCPHAPGVAHEELRNGVRVRRFRYAPQALQGLAYGAGGVLQNLRARRATVSLLPPFVAVMGMGLLRESLACDVIHANWVFSGFLACVARRLHRKPVVVTLRGSDVRLGRSQGVSRWMFDYTVRRATRVTAVSRSFGDGLEAARFRFISNGVSVSEKGEQDAPSEELRLLVLGSLVPGKRVDMVVEAVAVLDARGLDIHLEIAGGGDERSGLEAQAGRLGLDSRVVFLGQLDHAEALKRIARANCLVLASEWEGRPNVLLEAMAAGVPFVASDLPGCTECADGGRNGLLFRSGEVTDLADKLEWVARNRNEAAEMGQRGRQFVVREGLSWDRCAERYLKVFEEALCAES